jgi:hypothetical protein
VFNDLKRDIAEQHNLTEKYPKVVQRLTKELEHLVNCGASRPGVIAKNDTKVRFDITQSRRWAENSE